MRVLLSIKPEYIQKIFSGQKKYEYRKSLFVRTDVTTVVMYATLPVGLVVGEFDIESLIVEDPHSMWLRTAPHSGVMEDFFFSYYDGRNTAYAIQIGQVRQYETPSQLSEFKEGLKAPQSYLYLDQPVTCNEHQSQWELWL